MPLLPFGSPGLSLLEKGSLLQKQTSSNLAHLSFHMCLGTTTLGGFSCLTGNSALVHALIYLTQVLAIKPYHDLAKVCKTEAITTAAHFLNSSSVVRLSSQGRHLFLLL